MPERKKPTWQYWALAGIVLLPVLYVLSMGPLSWLLMNRQLPPWFVEAVIVYVEPFNWLYAHGPRWWQAAVESNLRLWR